MDSTAATATTPPYTKADPRGSTPPPTGGHLQQGMIQSPEQNAEALRRQYDSAVVARNERDQWIQEQRDQAAAAQEAEDSEECTFIPHISSYAQEMQRPASLSPENRIQAEQEAHREAQALAQQEAVNRELAGATFKPVTLGSTQAPGGPSPNRGYSEAPTPSRRQETVPPPEGRSASAQDIYTGHTYVPLTSSRRASGNNVPAYRRLYEDAFPRHALEELARNNKEAQKFYERLHSLQSYIASGGDEEKRPDSRRVNTLGSRKFIEDEHTEDVINRLENPRLEADEVDELIERLSQPKEYKEPEEQRRILSASETDALVKRLAVPTSHDNPYAHTQTHNVFESLLRASVSGPSEGAKHSTKPQYKPPPDKLEGPDCTFKPVTSPVSKELVRRQMERHLIALYATLAEVAETETVSVVAPSVSTPARKLSETPSNASSSSAAKAPSEPPVSVPTEVTEGGGGDGALGVEAEPQARSATPNGPPVEVAITKSNGGVPIALLARAGVALLPLELADELVTALQSAEGDSITQEQFISLFADDENRAKLMIAQPPNRQLFGAAATSSAANAAAALSSARGERSSRSSSATSQRSPSSGYTRPGSRPVSSLPENVRFGPHGELFPPGYQPKIDPNSERIAKQYTVEQRVAHRLARQDKVSRAQEERDRALATELTFKPRINSGGSHTHEHGSRSSSSSSRDTKLTLAEIIARERSALDEAREVRYQSIAGVPTQTTAAAAAAAAAASARGASKSTTLSLASRGPSPAAAAAKQRAIESERSASNASAEQRESNRLERLQQLNRRVDQQLAHGVGGGSTTPSSRSNSSRVASGSRDASTASSLMPKAYNRHYSQMLEQETGRRHAGGANNGSRSGSRTNSGANSRGSSNTGTPRANASGGGGGFATIVTPRPMARQL